MSSFLDKEGLQYFYNKLKDKFDTAIAQKADKSIATPTADGLMSSSDKAKLNEIVENGSLKVLRLDLSSFSQTVDTNGREYQYYPTDEATLKEWQNTVDTIILTATDPDTGTITMATLQKSYYSSFFIGLITGTDAYYLGTPVSGDDDLKETGFYITEMHTFETIDRDIAEINEKIKNLSSASAQTKQNATNISSLSAKTISINNQVTANTSNISALQSKLNSSDFLKKDSTKRASVLMGDGTYNTVKTIDGQPILGDGDIATDSNCYYLDYSTVFKNKTAVTQDVYDIVKDVFESNGKKHLYIYDPSVTVATSSEASIGIFWGRDKLYVTWINVNGILLSGNKTFFAYIIDPDLTLTCKDLNLRSTFSGATASEKGVSGWVPAPTTADTESYLCGNGKWQKVSGGSAKAVDMYPLLADVVDSGWDKLSTSEKNTKYDAIKKAIAENQLFYYNLGVAKLPCTCMIVGSGTTDEYLLIVVQYTLGYANGYSGNFSSIYVQPNDMFVQIRASDYSRSDGYITSQLFSGYNIKTINGQDITCSTDDGSGNLELKFVYKLDPNNFNFNDVAKAVIDGCIIQFTNWLLYTGVCASQVIPLTSSSDIATATTVVKTIRIDFSSRNGKEVFADSITLTGDSKWSWNYMSNEFMMKSDYVIDTEMSDTSTHPVTNKAIKAYIDKLIGKQ